MPFEMDGGTPHIAAAITLSGSHLLAYIPPGHDGTGETDWVLILTAN